MAQIVEKSQDQRSWFVVRVVLPSGDTTFMQFPHDPSQEEVDAAVDRYVAVVTEARDGPA